METLDRCTLGNAVNPPPSQGKPVEWKPLEKQYPAGTTLIRPYLLGKSIEWKLVPSTVTFDVA